MRLTTPRLVLREIGQADFEDLFAMYSDAESRRFEGGPVTLAEMHARFDQVLQDAKKIHRTHFRFALTLTGQDRLVGWVKLELANASIREYETGWAVKRELWGRGYATEAAREVLRFGFRHLHAHRIIAFCHDQNQASFRVMEKLGMRREAWLRETRWLEGGWSNELLYAILEHEFSG